MKKFNILLIALLLAGCVVKPTFIPQVPNVQKVEQQPLPPDPATLPIPPEILKDGNWVVPLEAGSCIPAPPSNPPVVKPCPDKSGLFESEAHAIRDQQYRVSYNELRKTYEADRNIWSEQRSLYEGTIKDQQEQINELQPTWFEQNQFMIGILGGFLLGTASVVVIIAVTK